MGLVTYVNYPTTEYLNLGFLDFQCFNVYLETPEKLRAYLARLQNNAGDRPLVMAELGLDSRRNGLEQKAQVLNWQVRDTFAAGCAGMFVFAWTDQWHRGGFDIEDWDFGLTTRDREPKPALSAVAGAYAQTPFPMDRDWPKVSVIVCTYNGSRTIVETLEALKAMVYPNYEIVVVNDGSTDSMRKLLKPYEADGRFKVIHKDNGGLSSARNEGVWSATGRIAAYIDDDAYPGPYWLFYVAHHLMTTDHVAVGGPNVPPWGDGLIGEVVAHSPGGSWGACSMPSDSANPSRPLRVVVMVYVVRFPLGGMAWHYLQYAMGLQRLGHEVLVLEDSEDYPCCYDPSRHVTETDPAYGLRFAREVFSRTGLGGHWAYHDAHTHTWHGPRGRDAIGFCESADLVINISGANAVRPWLEPVPRRVFIDTDPAFEQVRQLTVPHRRQRAARHNVFMTFGESVGTPGWSVPDDGWPWRLTRQPVVLDAWAVTPTPDPGGGALTTVMQWDSYPAREYEGRQYGLKARSFDPYFDLPGRCQDARLELALGSPDAPRPRLQQAGWRLSDLMMAWVGRRRGPAEALRSRYGVLAGLMLAAGVAVWLLLPGVAQRLVDLASTPTSWDTRGHPARFYLWMFQYYYPVLTLIYPLGAVLLVRRWGRLGVFVVCAFVPVVLAHLFVFTSRGAERYLTYILPFFFIVSACAAESLIGWVTEAARALHADGAKLMAAALVVAAVPASGVFAYPWLNASLQQVRYGVGPDWKQLADDLHSACGHGVVLTTWPREVTFYGGRFPDFIVTQSYEYDDRSDHNVKIGDRQVSVRYLRDADRLERVLAEPGPVYFVTTDWAFDNDALVSEPMRQTVRARMRPIASVRGGRDRVVIYAKTDTD